MIDYYDKDGLPITFTGFRELRADDKYFILARDVLDNGYVVSTVWLGMDHNLAKVGDPLIFETMVFSSESSYSDLACRRYSTEREAYAGHAEMVDLWNEIE